MEHQAAKAIEPQSSETKDSLSLKRKVEESHKKKLNTPHKRKAEEQLTRQQRKVLEDESMIHIQGQKYMKVMQRQQQPMVNIREYITDVDGNLHPTKKGILLSEKDWKSFKKQTKSVDKLLKQHHDVCQYL